MDLDLGSQLKTIVGKDAIHRFIDSVDDNTKFLILTMDADNPNDLGFATGNHVTRPEANWMVDQYKMMLLNSAEGEDAT